MQVASKNLTGDLDKESANFSSPLVNLSERVPPAR